MLTSVTFLKNANPKVKVESHPEPKHGAEPWVNVNIHDDRGALSISIPPEAAEALYFALSAALFDGDLSAKPLEDRDNTKPADIDGPIHADMTPEEAKSIADRYANGVAAASDNSVLEITD